MKKPNWTVRDRFSCTAGAVLVLLGISLTKWSIESAIVTVSINLLIIIVFQLILVGSGVFLLTNQPAIKLPSRPELILLVFGIVGAFLIGETATRVYLRADNSGIYPNYSWFPKFEEPLARWTPHPYLNYYPTPNYKSGLRFHNSLGYRDDEFTVDKPNGVYRIVGLGGSTTYTNAVVDNGQTFTAQLGKVLTNQYGYDRIQVINAGVAGYTSLESLLNLELRVLDLDPDLVIIYLGGNEMHRRLIDPSVYRGDSTGYVKQWDQPRLWFLTRSAFISGITYQFRGVIGGLPTFDLGSRFRAPAAKSPKSAYARKAAWYLEKNPPVFFERNLRSMLAIAKEHDVKILLATFASSERFSNHYASTDVYKTGFDEQNDMVKQVAESHEVLLLDFDALMPQEKLYWNDGVHLNEKGALLKAKTFAEFIHEKEVIPENHRDS